nr:hypothetical protein [Lacrimispora amygdalina]
MAKKNVRNMKVCGQSGYKYETVPVHIPQKQGSSAITRFIHLTI